jgi:hypothetical protein
MFFRNGENAIRGSWVPAIPAGAGSAGTTSPDACSGVIPAWIAGIQWPRKTVARLAETSC